MVIHCFSSPIPIWIQAVFPSEERAGLLVAMWVLSRLDAGCTDASSACHLCSIWEDLGSDRQEAASGLRKKDNMYSRGKCWRTTQVLFSFEEQGGKQLSDPSCLPPGTARAGIHQVFPAMNIAAGLLEPRDTPGLKMELCFCFETCLGLWPSTSIFPSHFLS